VAIAVEVASIIFVEDESFIIELLSIMGLEVYMGWEAMDDISPPEPPYEPPDDPP